MEKFTEETIRRRMHGLYLSRKCDDIVDLSNELLGLHCWFHRNVAFSAVIRGAGLAGWKERLIKTWLYRGTLHGVDYSELPLLLALHADAVPWAWFGIPDEQADEVAEEVIALMNDGVYSRAEMRKIFADRFERETVERLFSPWGGIFVYLARQGRVSFRNMTSRDFDLINAEPTLTRAEALDILLRRFFEVYGPATTADAEWFFGLKKGEASGCEPRGLRIIGSNERSVYYCSNVDVDDLPDIPHITLLSGFDPYIVSYTDRGAALPDEYRKAVILKSGICLPTIAIDGQVAGLWNIKKNEPIVEFFTPQPKRIERAALDMVAEMAFKTHGQI